MNSPRWNGAVAATLWNYTVAAALASALLITAFNAFA